MFMTKLVVDAVTRN